jgi:hypothetical protein
MSPFSTSLPGKTTDTGIPQMAVSLQLSGRWADMVREDPGFDQSLAASAATTKKLFLCFFETDNHATP